MRTFFVVAGAFALSQVIAIPRSAVTPPKEYPIRPVALTSVRLNDRFWAPRTEVNRTVTIPHIMQENEITGRVDNFLKAAGKKDGPYQGQRYNDTDVYKVMEAASWSLMTHPDPALSKKLDDLIAIIEAAQQPDGYLYNPRTIDPKNPAPGAGPERWSWLLTSHELYDQGHMIEAAVAHYSATGKRNFLDVAIKSADLMVDTFGWNKRRDVPGHEEVELALVKLYRVTGNEKYLNLAKFFVAERGRGHGVERPVFEHGSRFFMYNDAAYRQDQTPVNEQTTAIGHAVRATYLYSAMTDLSTIFDGLYDRTLGALFDDVTERKMYVTGGLGAVAGTEAFGAPYELPNRAYAETCASVGGILWYHRTFLRTGTSAAYNALERTLYNGYLSGVSLAGDTFFYQNPLVSDGRQQRSAYFDVACCPANLARLMEELPGLIYAQQGRRIYVNLFIGSEADLTMNGAEVHVAQRTDYPWDGRVTFALASDAPFSVTLALRIPDWALPGAATPNALYRYAQPLQERPSISVNGTAVPLSLRNGYADVTRRWQRGDTVVLTLPMPVRRVLADDRVKEDAGRSAIQRGPVVYALEGVDNGGTLKDVTVPLDASATHAFRPDLLNGVETITLKAGDRTVTAVPYYAWNNRGRGEMEVWVPYGSAPGAR
ncbi:MAG TPA: beta-L-arabinofuranosidase domain-containing protein [Vicinamibacterales bacterium]|nr:beta-L-arabinofuranosidase domain-containing protein [Vicinamibacterales bacterium]